MKARLDQNGLHLFDRTSGLNVLIEEVLPSTGVAPADAPRYVSIALTNACDLACAYCYAPKQPARLRRDRLERWLLELDANGCLGIGFGGGEPTLYPRFGDLCQWVVGTTDLAVTFTTHGHRLTDELCGQLSGAVHFVRVSMDGVGRTYESLRGRPFSGVMAAMSRIRNMAPFGINFVVNADTIGELDAAAAVAESVGAVELLLLPQRATASAAAIDADVQAQLHDWIAKGSSTVRLAVSERGATDGLPLAQPFHDASSLDAHAHVDANGVVKASSFDDAGVPVTDSVMAALGELRGCTCE